MRWRKKSFEIRVDIYLTNVYVSFGDIEGLREILRNLKNPPDEDQLKEMTSFSNDYDGVVFPLKNRDYIVYFPNKLVEEAYFLSVINHEVFHVVHGILNGIGMSLTNKSQEAYAYLTGYINKKIYEQLQ